MTTYTTKSGVVLQIGRVARERIDRLATKHVLPEPPTRMVEVFGGIEEEIPILDDPDYLAAMQEYHLLLGQEQVALLADAVTFAELDELDELRALGLIEDDADLLQYVLADEAELAEVIGEVLYESTVTERGIAEANAAFAVTWHERPVEAWHVPGTPGRYSAMYEARMAAQDSSYHWREFCAMGGSEQSTVVAFFRLKGRLEWLQMQAQKRKR